MPLFNYYMLVYKVKKAAYGKAAIKQDLMLLTAYIITLNRLPLEAYL